MKINNYKTLITIPEILNKKINDKKENWQTNISTYSKLSNKTKNKSNFLRKKSEAARNLIEVYRTTIFNSRKIKRCNNETLMQRKIGNNPIQRNSNKKIRVEIKSKLSSLPILPKSSKIGYMESGISNQKFIHF